MKLSVATPLAIVLDVERVKHVRAEDDTGAFGVLDRHADFLTSLTPCVVSWRDDVGGEHYVAVRGGMLQVRGAHVAIATPEAVTSDDLALLEGEVLARFRRELDAERAARTELQRLYLAAVRQIYRFLRQERRTGCAELNVEASLEEFTS